MHSSHSSYSKYDFKAKLYDFLINLTHLANCKFIILIIQFNDYICFFDLVTNIPIKPISYKVHDFLFLFYSRSLRVKSDLILLNSIFLLNSCFLISA